MKDEATKEVIQYGIDALDNGYEGTEGAELHNAIYNEDYFIIGYANAEEFLNKYGTFNAIDEVKNYEQYNFGEVTTDLSESESVANMFAYIKGEEALNECNTLRDNWDKKLNAKDLQAIKEELEAQL